MITIPTPIITLEGEEIELRPLTEYFKAALYRYCKSDIEDTPEKAEDRRGDLGEQFFAGYILAASAPTTKESGRILMSSNLKEVYTGLQVTMREEDIEAVQKYLSDIFDAASRADIEVARTPGKSKRKPVTRQKS